MTGWACGVETDGRKSRQNDRRARRYGIWNLPLAHARGSATIGFPLPQQRLLVALGPAIPPVRRTAPGVEMSLDAAR